MIRKSSIAIGALALVMVGTPAFTLVARAQGSAAPMDHAAMASSYQAEASEAQQKAAQHEQMVSSYKHMPMLPKGSAVTKDAMVEHCQKLAAAYKQVGAQASSLAKIHQGAATSQAGH